MGFLFSVSRLVCSTGSRRPGPAGSGPASSVSSVSLRVLDLKSCEGGTGTGPRRAARRDHRCPTRSRSPTRRSEQTSEMIVDYPSRWRVPARGTYWGPVVDGGVWRAGRLEKECWRRAGSQPKEMRGRSSVRSDKSGRGDEAPFGSGDQARSGHGGQ